MLFNSLKFLAFFPCVALVYGIIPRRTRYIWLLAASWFFYMCWNPRYIVLILVSTAVTYVAGIIIGKVKEQKKAKVVLTICVVLNLGILVMFKYAGWLADIIRSLTGRGIVITLILPVGISFYIFQALGYIIDVYRKKIEPERNFFKYALFVSFFPQLVAGPIERSENLLKQIRNMHQIKFWNYERITSGLTVMLWGFFLKLVIADRIGVFVDYVFADYYVYGSVELILAAVGFAIQIYCDFLSYSTIAVGTARVFGIELMENFSTPYFSRSIREFWRRWHISLSSWFKDYVYIPLGGSRGTRGKYYRNLMITFLVSGLWHGANWTFLAWGGVHGSLQIIENILSPAVNKLNRKIGTKVNSISYKLGQMAVTFSLVTIAWVFFRAETIRDAGQYIVRMFMRFNPWVLFDGSLYTLGLDRMEVSILMAALTVLFVISCIRYRLHQNIDTFLGEQCIWFRWLVLLVLIFGVVIFGVYGPEYDVTQFIYFQF